MNYTITHRTIYDYTAAVSASFHAARFEPQTVGGQICHDHDLRVWPSPSVQKKRVDYFGNRVVFFSIQEMHRKLEVSARSRVSVIAATPPALYLSEPWEAVCARFRDPVSPMEVQPYEFCLDSPLLMATPELADYARQSFPAGTPALVGVRDLARRIFRDFKYDPRATTVATPLDEVMQKRAGVCQDFAHIAIAALRSLGLPARYVSGYLRTNPQPGKERLIGADASHAWFSAYCPQTGWLDFDPTNDLLVGEDHITVAMGRDFSDVSPLSGILTGGGEHEAIVSVDVKPES
jgi:transglutaminase-like putative cysteine protease